ncbi:MAG: 50S ribosomal protein L1 [Gammaproteobacteria bacterium]
MAKISKRRQAIREKAVPGTVYSIQQAIELLKSMPKVKFVESVEVSINLGVDTRKSDQMVRGATVLPHGTGRTVRVAVFAGPEKQKEAEQAGADVIGFEDLVETVKNGEINFDVVIATPDAMRIVGKLGQVLGPRGLMPNPKVGTVTNDIALAVKNAKGGQVQYRTDKAGIIHSPIGKINFETEHLVGNLSALVADLKKLKPSNSKGVYVRKVTLSSTMGPGLVIDASTISA